MKLKRKKGTSPGAFTVEATIVMPIVLLTIFGMIQISIIQFQSVTTRVAAMRTASRVSYCWDFLGRDKAWGKDKDTGAVTVAAHDYSSHDPYGAIVDTKKDTRLKNAKAYFGYMQGKNVTLKGEVTDSSDVKYNWGILNSSISVSVKKHFINPMANLTGPIGVGERTDLSVTAKAPINDPVEFIRLAGLVYDQIKGR